MIGRELQSTDIPIEGVAGKVGYEDTSFFSRLSRREISITPTQYRRRFGALRRSLPEH